MTDRLTPSRYGPPPPSGGHHHPHESPQEAPTMTEKLTPAQRRAAAYSATPTAESRQRADLAQHYRPGEAEALTTAADKLPGKGTMRLRAAYAQAAKDAHEAGQQ